MADKKANWGKLGGTHAMHGKTGTGQQQPGVSSQEGGGALSRDIKPKAGGSGDGFYSNEGTNKDYAGQQQSGTSGPTKTGGDGKFAKGGSGQMYGPGVARAAIGGRTASN